MSASQLTDEQIIEWVEQLPTIQQKTLLRVLLTKQWQTWMDLSREGEKGVRMAASQRGRDWDAMSEDEREAFVDDLIHEDRQCIQ